ncbi:hypothetical protein CUMW_137580 [Citrus unshiu]|uniref:Uncharacterized protein n=1 Tax=Citrus unshiu TaxID=55188 RepID=A0A2H5PHM1_CITUN|nr:hypothetical protein CUMW_137580 [Citrus unshiu]
MMSSSMEEEPFHFFGEILAFTIDDKELMHQDMGIDICKSWKSLSVEERRGAINAARIFNPKNPSFLVFLQASNLQMHHVYVLATFARKCLSGDECIIEQDSDESRLAVAFKLNCSIF